MAKPRPELFVLLLGLAVAQVRGQSPDRPTIAHWADLAGSRPIQVTLSHDLELTTGPQPLHVTDSHWHIQRLALAVFDGRVDIEAAGRVRQQRLGNLRTTVTLHRADVQRMMRFLSIGPAGDVRGRATGWFAFHIHQGRWQSIEIHLRSEPGTLKIRRHLLKELLVARTGVGIEPGKIDDILDAHYGSGTEMLPMGRTTLEGRLDRDQLRMNLPLGNQALTIRLEPRIERRLLKDILEVLFDRLGLAELLHIEWVLNETDPDP